MPVSPAQRQRVERQRVEIANRLKPTMNWLGPPLTTPEQDRLVELEGVVDRGLGTFVEVGLALKEIRDNKLYRTKHATFENYCQQRWRLSRIHGHRLIEAAGVARDLLPIGNNLLTCEAQARELVPLSPEERRRVWIEVSAPGQPAPTAERIKNVIRELRAGGTHKSQAVLFEERMEKVRRRIVRLLEPFEWEVELMFKSTRWATSTAEEKRRCARKTVMVFEELASLASQMAAQM